MNVPRRIIERMASKEGWTNIRDNRGLVGDKGIYENVKLPTYDNDNDLDRYIRGMDNDTKYAYFDALCLTVATEEEWAEFGTQAGHDAIMIKCLSATTEQKLTAIIKAEGWE